MIFLEGMPRQEKLYNDDLNALNDPRTLEIATSFYLSIAIPALTSSTAEEITSIKQYLSEPIEISGALIPQKAIDIVDYVEENGSPMQGYKGGQAFKNSERLLPETDANGVPIKYREYDVNPLVKNVNRGTERVVIGGGRAYYTNDHYRSFIKIK